MTAPHIVDPAGVLSEALLDASPDLMRSLLQTMINALLSADADAVVGAEWGKPSPDRTAQRNGYRHRDLDTRVGTIDVAVPQRSEEHTSELQSLMRTSYAVFCLKKNNKSIPQLTQN